MTKTLRFGVAMLLATCSSNFAFSQSLSVNTTGATAATSSILDVSSTDKGMLVPRMSKAQKNAIATPATGLLVYQNAPDSTGFHYYDGTKWVWLAAAMNKEWSITGNSNITSQHFLGTTNDSALRFRVKNQPSGIIDSATLNTAFGYKALPGAGGDRNVAIGMESLALISTGFRNTSLGTRTLSLSDTISENTAVGYGSLYRNIRNRNTAVGYYAGINNSNGNQGPRHGTENTAIGYKSLLANGGGKKNTAVGHYALAMYQDGFYIPGSADRNTAVGDSSQALALGIGNTSVGSASLSLINSGSYNVAMGDSAMASAGSTNYHTALGTKALKNTNAIAYGNTAVGMESMEYDTSGFYNVAVGFRALRNKKNGSENTALGVGALEYGDSTDWSVAVGRGALFNYGTSSQNTAVGTWAMNKKVSGVYNTAIGLFAMDDDSIGVSNTAIGTSSLRFGKRGLDNTGLGINTGYYALDSFNTFLGAYAGRGQSGLSTGGNNTGVGSRALLNFTSATQNAALGEYALSQDTSGSWNVAMGAGALDFLRDGDNNVAAGFWSSRLNVNGNSNVTIGVAAGYRNRLSNIVAIGDSSLYWNSNLATGTQGFYNTAVGSKSAYSNTTGYSLSALGYQALYSNSSGYENVAVGDSALRNNASGAQNVAIGSAAMQANNFGLQNTVVGNQALRAATSASAISAFGYRALASFASGSGSYYNNAFGDYAGESLLSGDRNVMMGSWAMRYKTGGAFNTAIGNRAQGFATGAAGSYNSSLGAYSLGNSTGDNNIGIGYSAGYANTSGSNNIFIGHESEGLLTNLTNASAIGSYAAVGASNSMVLGSINGVNAATADTKVGIGTVTPDSTFSVADRFLVGSSGTVQYDNSTPTMMYMFKSGTTNTDRMVLAHSLANSSWGLQYQDATDQFNFIGGGLPALSIELGSRNVGIGTLNPATNLHINPGTAANVNARIQSFSSTYEPGLELIKSGAGSDWKVKVDNNGYLVYARSTDDMATPTDYYETWTNFFRPSVDNGSSLGTTGNKWSVVYAQNGTINTSDAREKDNIKDLNYGLKEIMQLRPVSYTWKNNPQWGQKLGFIAQEVRPILNEVVQEGNLKSGNPLSNDNGKDANAKNDRLGIYYTDIIPVAVKAIQEQQATINTQKNTIESLEAKNRSLEERLRRIEQKLGIQ
jgi:hypothetical protein